MKKIGYIVTIALLLVIMLFILADFVLYEPLLNHFHRDIERNWGCKVIRKGSDVDLLKGSLRVKDISMMTDRAVFSKWCFKAKEIFIQIDYFSLIGRNIVFKKLILDKVIFKQEYIEGLNIDKKGMSRGIAENGDQKELSHTRNGRSQRKILVRDFLIKDGFFEFHYLKNSGGKGKFKAEHVKLSKKDLFLNGKPTEFFRSLFEGMKGF